MVDIKTLRKYQKRGVKLNYEERLRLAKEDARKMKRLRNILYKIAWVSIFVGVISLYRMASYVVRGYNAVGAEIFFPWVVIFAWWIYQEHQSERG